MRVDDARLDPRVRFAQPVVGPSHTFGFKLTAVGLLVSLGGYAARVLERAPEMSQHVALVSLGAAGLLLVSSWWLLFGKTVVDATGIRKSGWWKTEVRWEEIGRASYLRVPLSPRLVVMTGSGPMRSFFAGSPALQDAFREIERIYRP